MVQARLVSALFGTFSHARILILVHSAYVTLIRYAVLGSPHQRLTLGEIYECIEERYPFYKSAGKGWKNSIRHNLSLNKCFKKVARHVL